MINFSIHLHMYVWIINQLLTWPSLRRDGTAVCFPSSSLPVAGAGVFEFAFRAVNFNRLAGVHLRSGYVEETGELWVCERERRCQSLLCLFVCVPHFAISPVQFSARYWHKSS